MKSFSKKRPLSSQGGVVLHSKTIRRYGLAAAAVHGGPVHRSTSDCDCDCDCGCDTMQDARAATRRPPILNKSDKTKTANSPSRSLSMRQLRGTHTHTEMVGTVASPSRGRQRARCRVGATIRYSRCPTIFFLVVVMTALDRQDDPEEEESTSICILESKGKKNKNAT